MNTSGSMSPSRATNGRGRGFRDGALTAERFRLNQPTMRPSKPALSDALPIDPVLPALKDALAATTNVVLQAPPGAGKTTRVPLALLDAPWLDGRRIVMLEPRRPARY